MPSESTETIQTRCLAPVLPSLLIYLLPRPPPERGSPRHRVTSPAFSAPSPCAQMPHVGDPARPRALIGLSWRGGSPRPACRVASSSRPALLPDATAQHRSSSCRPRSIHSVGTASLEPHHRRIGMQICRYPTLWPRPAGGRPYRIT